MTTVATNKVPAVVDLMRRPTTYTEQAPNVAVVETHSSWVFLTSRFAYKLKKPVRYEFLDFSTPDRRQAACLEELRLNRRFAPDVYLNVLPITQTPRGKLQLNRAGHPVDWVIKMRRLPADRTLDELLRRGQVGSSEIQRIATMLIDTLVGQPPLTIQPHEYRQRLENHLHGNLGDLLSCLPLRARDIASLHAAQQRLLTLLPTAFDRRVLDGRVVDGHGDLRPEHIYLTNPPVVIDCLEFSEELRQLDMVDEFCFLSMECELLGQPAVSQTIFHRYIETTGDQPPEWLQSFYKCYRACVRAKVLGLRAKQLDNARHDVAVDAAERYLDLAQTYLPKLGPPFVLVVSGTMGTGKSTLAAGVADSLHCELLQTDRVRRELFGGNGSNTPYGEGIYTEASRDQVYDSLADRAGELMLAGQPIVLDGTFLQPRWRRQIMTLARRHDYHFVHVHCGCPRETALCRLRMREERPDRLSDGRSSLYDQQACEWSLASDEPPLLPIDTSTALDDQVTSSIDWIRRNLADGM